MSIGLAVMKCAPLHHHHIEILTAMNSTCDESLLLLGHHDRFTVAARAAMIRAVFGERILIGTIDDIGGQSTADWGVHVLKAAMAILGKLPTDYFCGRREDGIWLRDFFYHAEFAEFASNPRKCPSPFGPYVRSYDPVDDSFADGSLVVRELHMITNPVHSHISATAVRTYLTLGDPRWMTMVPRVNHERVWDAWTSQAPVLAHAA